MLSISCLRNRKFIFCFVDTEPARRLPYHTKQFWHFSKEARWSLLLLCQETAFNKVKSHQDNLRQLISGVVAAVVRDMTYFMRTETPLSELPREIWRKSCPGSPIPGKCAWALIHWQWSLTEIPSGKTMDFPWPRKLGNNYVSCLKEFIFNHFFNGETTHNCYKKFTLKKKKIDNLCMNIYITVYSCTINYNYLSFDLKSRLSLCGDCLNLIFCIGNVGTG